MPLKIVVVGAGAVGGLVGGWLSLAGHRVALVGRKPVVDRITSHGLRLRWPGGERTAAEGLVATTGIGQSFRRYGPFDVLVLTVKSYDTEAVIAELKAESDVPLRLLSLQNGIGNEERLAEAFGRERVVAGTLTMPVSVDEPGAVRLEKSRGGVGLASLQPGRSLVELVTAFQRAGFASIELDDFRSLKWSKLLLNLLGNATAAILGWTPGQVFADAKMAHLEIRAMREALAAMRAQSIRVKGLPGYPAPLLALAVRSLPTPVLRLALQPLVSGGRGDKPPSLALDLARCPPRSEVNWLNGAVVKYGAQAGVLTPVNQTLTETLLELTASPEARRCSPQELWARAGG